VNEAPGKEGEGSSKSDALKDAQKKLDDAVKAGKVQVAMTKAEMAAEKAAAASQPKGKKAKRVRDGPSAFYYDDDNSIQMDYPIIQKFSKLGLAPPMETDSMAKKNDEIVKLREALKLAGKIEKTVRKSELLKDKSFVEAEDHLELKKQYEALDYDTKKSVEKIKHEAMFGTELTIGSGEYEDDRDRDRRPGNRYTQLRPNTTRGPRDGRSRDRNDRNDRQRAQSTRRQDRDDGDRQRDGGNRQRQRNKMPA